MKISIMFPKKKQPLKYVCGINNIYNFYMNLNQKAECFQNKHYCNVI